MGPPELPMGSGEDGGPIKWSQPGDALGVGLGVGPVNNSSL